MRPGDNLVPMAAYREYRPPAAMADVVACLWDHEPDEDYSHVVVPDGCVDLIWLANRTLVIAGADTGPRRVQAIAGARSSAIRLRPGAAGAVLGVPAGALLDQEVDARLVWDIESDALSDSLAAAQPERRLELLAEAVAVRRPSPDRLVLTAARRLARADARISTVAADLGVSERQLHRRTTAAVGYGPKMLARIARLRRLVTLTGLPLVDRASVAGYASQAHMNDEVRRLTGSTPVRFLKDAVLTAA